MKVKAIKQGWDGISLRKEGEVFEIAGECPVWAIPVKQSFEQPERQEIVPDEFEPEVKGEIDFEQLTKKEIVEMAFNDYGLKLSDRETKEILIQKYQEAVAIKD